MYALWHYKNKRVWKYFMFSMDKFIILFAEKFEKGKHIFSVLKYLFLHSYLPRKLFL